MSQTTVEEVRAIVKSGLSDSDLGDVIDRAEFELIQIAGEPQNSELTVTAAETHYGGIQNVFLKRPISSITSVVEDDVTLETTNYRSFAKQGRLVRLPLGGVWGDEIVVTYVPAENLELFKQAVIDLVRNIISRTTMQSESIAGEYSYTNGDWQKEAQGSAKRLYFKGF